MPEIPELQGRIGDEVVELRAIAGWDIPEILIAHQDDPMLHRLLGADRPPTGAQLGMEVEGAESARLAGGRVSLTLVEPGANYCRGRIDVHEIDWTERSAEIGIWVAPQFRGRGFARRALIAASGWLFDVVGLRRLTLLTGADNEPMLRAGAAAGFVVEISAAQATLVLTRPDA